MDNLLSLLLIFSITLSFGTSLKCYDCFGNDAKCKGNEVETIECAENEICFVAVGSKNNETIRKYGCSEANVSLQNIPEFKNLGIPFECETCEKDLCNSVPFAFSCYDCDGFSDQCHDSSTMPTAACPSQMCYAAQGNISEITMYARGCADTETFCDTISQTEEFTVQNCTICKSDLCNGAEKPPVVQEEMWCYECLGNKANCSNSDIMSRRNCTNQRFCFAAEGEIFLQTMFARGCTSDIDICQVIESNLTDFGGMLTDCKICENNLCNGAVCDSDDCKGNAFTATITTALYVVLLLISMNINY